MSLLLTGVVVVIIVVGVILYIAAKEGERQMRNHMEELEWYGPQNTDDN